MSTAQLGHELYRERMPDEQAALEPWADATSFNTPTNEWFQMMLPYRAGFVIVLAGVV